MTNKNHILTTIRANIPALTQLGIRNIGLFGSYVRNEQSEKSDIDLLIDFEPDKENYDNFLAIYDMLEQLFKNEQVEIVTMNGLDLYVGPEIMNEVVYV